VASQDALRGKNAPLHRQCRDGDVNWYLLGSAYYFRQPANKKKEGIGRSALDIFQSVVRHSLPLDASNKFAPTEDLPHKAFEGRMRKIRVRIVFERACAGAYPQRPNYIACTFKNVPDFARVGFDRPPPILDRRRFSPSLNCFGIYIRKSNLRRSSVRARRLRSSESRAQPEPTRSRNPAPGSEFD
jgi:hypothetical protein